MEITYIFSERKFKYNTKCSLCGRILEGIIDGYKKGDTKGFRCKCGFYWEEIIPYNLGEKTEEKRKIKIIKENNFEIDYEAICFNCKEKIFGKYYKSCPISLIHLYCKCGALNCINMLKLENCYRKEYYLKNQKQFIENGENKEMIRGNKHNGKIKEVGEMRIIKREGKKVEFETICIFCGRLVKGICNNIYFYNSAMVPCKCGQAYTIDILQFRENIGENKIVNKVKKGENKMREFETGATRNTDIGKFDYEGFNCPLVDERYAQYLNKHRVQEDGKIRASDNWQKGIPLKVYIKSLYRHFVDFRKAHRGYKVRESIEDLLCAIIFNAKGYLHELLKARINKDVKVERSKNKVETTAESLTDFTHHDNAVNLII